VPQLIALTVTLIVYFAVWRWRRARWFGTTRWCEFCAALRAFTVFILLVAMAAVLPRPMAALRVADPDAIVFDVHSHTNYSHDASHTFTVEENRKWHRAAGFDAAYITDHRCFDGAEEGMRANPKRAGDGTVILSGIEIPERHVVILEAPNTKVPNGLLETWCARIGSGVSPRVTPVRIQTIPEDLAKMVPATHDSVNGVIAIEISDGAPRGLAQADRDDGVIWGLASTFHLTPVAGSNNHGWGRTAAAWNVMRIPGWRTLTPDSVGKVIEARFRSDRGGAVQVIERTRLAAPDTQVIAVLVYALLPINFAFQILSSMSRAETLSWLAWTWGITAIVLLARRRVRTA
jgi:hypothetical protein